MDYSNVTNPRILDHVSHLRGTAEDPALGVYRGNDNVQNQGRDVAAVGG